MTMPSATSAIPATATMTRPAVRGQHVRGVIPRGGVTRSRPGAVHDKHQGDDERDGIADAVNQCPDPVALGQVQPPHRDLDKTSVRPFRGTR
jgi:hypothetical protein